MYIRAMQPGQGVLPLLGLHLLGPCSGVPEQNLTRVDSETSSAPSYEDLYLATVRESGYVDDASEIAFTAAGDKTCVALDRGTSPAHILALAPESGSDARVVILGTAVPTLFREQVAAVTELAKQS